MVVHDQSNSASILEADGDQWPTTPALTSDIDQWSMFLVDDSIINTPAEISPFSPTQLEHSSNLSDMDFFNDNPFSRSDPATEDKNMDNNMFDVKVTPFRAADPTDNRSAGSLVPFQLNEPLHLQTPALPREDTQTGCKCIQRIAYIVNELETSLNSGDEDNSQQSVLDLDSALGLGREALHYGEQMRQCVHCLSRPEQRIFLLLLANRLVLLCTRTVNTFRDLAHARSESSLSVLVGDYDVDSGAERDIVLKELISFRLRALASFLGTLEIAQRAQAAEFAVAKDKVFAIMRRLEQINIITV
jgi:hypothetical protein